MRGTRRIPLRALAATAGCALSFAVAIAQPPSGPAAGDTHTYTGTVCRIDTQAGTLDLLTGVGHAFLIHRVKFTTDVPVTSRGAAAAVTSLVPGTVCRVQCRTAGYSATATAVEVLAPAPSRTP